MRCQRTPLKYANCFNRFIQLSLAKRIMVEFYFFFTWEEIARLLSCAKTRKKAMRWNRRRSLRSVRWFTSHANNTRNNTNPTSTSQEVGIFFRLNMKRKQVLKTDRPLYLFLPYSRLHSDCLFPKTIDNGFVFGAKSRLKLEASSHRIWYGSSWSLLETQYQTIGKCHVRLSP